MNTSSETNLTSSSTLTHSDPVESSTNLSSGEAQLQRLPVDVLRRAYYKKLEEIEKEGVEKKFKGLLSAAEFKTQRDRLFLYLKESAGKSRDWMAKTHLTLGDRAIPMTLLLNFYDSQSEADFPFAPPTKNANSLCWNLTTFFGEVPSDQWAGSSACMEAMHPLGENFYIVQSLNVDTVEPTYTHLAAPVPIPLPSDTHFELLQTSSRKWIRGGNLDWNPISREQAQTIRKEFRQEQD